MNVQMSSKICIPNIGIVENVMDFLIPILVLIPLLEFDAKNFGVWKMFYSRKSHREHRKVWNSKREATDFNEKTMFGFWLMNSASFQIRATNFVWK